MSDPWWKQPCEDAVAKIPGGVMCPQIHCDSTIVKNYSEAYCSCSDSYPNGCSPTRYSGCCQWNAATPLPIISENCYCCCGCFANETPVAVELTKYKAIVEFFVGDMVYVANNPELSSWSQKEVLFSSGAGGSDSSTTMIKLTYDTEHGPDQLFVSRNQLFLMPDRKLKAASKLVPNQDELLFHDGTQAKVLALEVGTYKKGLHHISTSLEPTTNMDGHLILAKGIVCGDYALQLGLNGANDASLVDDHHKLPEFGSQAYFDQYPNLVGDALKAHHHDHTPESFDSDVFEHFGKKGPITIPEHAQYFISKDQAISILNNPASQIAPVYSNIGDDMVRYLFSFFKGFYPNVNFYFDKESQTPNAYSFVELGVTNVVISGGLVRTRCVTFDLIQFVIAHELGHLYGGNPENDSGLSCEGQSDYFAVTGVFSKVFYGLSSGPIIKSVMDTLKVFFDLIDEKLRQGVPGNKCMNISTDCRLKTINAAYTMQPLPECAGGPIDPALTVVGVEAKSLIGGTIVEVTFNEPVDPASAQVIGNYAFDPPVQANSARVDANNPSLVRLGVALNEPGDYTVCVYEVTSAKGEPLVQGSNCGSFTFKA